MRLEYNLRVKICDTRINKDKYMLSMKNIKIKK